MNNNFGTMKNNIMAFVTIYGLCAFQMTYAASPAVQYMQSKVNDKTKCKYTEIKGSVDGPESCQYLCDGPVSKLKTRLLSCYDYEHLYVKIDDKEYSTWSAMTKLGGFAGLGNNEGIVEWALSSKPPSKTSDVLGLIVRFQGTQAKPDGTSEKPKTALAVYDFRNDRVCWKGNFPTNEGARKALEKSDCKEILKPEVVK